MIMRSREEVNKLEESSLTEREKLVLSLDRLIEYLYEESEEGKKLVSSVCSKQVHANSDSVEDELFGVVVVSYGPDCIEALERYLNWLKEECVEVSVNESV